MSLSHTDLISVERIKVLKAKYFRLVDLQRWPEFAELLTRDVSLHFPEVRAEPFGYEDGLQMIRRDLKNAVTVHHGHSPEIRIVGVGKAKGIWAMEDRVWHFADARRDVCLRSFHGFGHYHETYVQIGENWLIESLRLVRIRKVVESTSIHHEFPMPTGAAAAPIPPGDEE